MNAVIRSPHQQRVDDFMRKAGQDLPAAPCIPDENTRRLRAILILEEALETIKALGFWPAQIDTHLNPAGEPDLEGIADGCADISVVTIGTLSACGIADQPILEEVDQANLRKFGPGGHRREDGKWIKPADWTPPNIMGRLEAQGLAV